MNEASFIHVSFLCYSGPMKSKFWDEIRRARHWLRKMRMRENVEGDRGCWKTFCQAEMRSKLSAEENGAGVGGEAGWDSPGPQCSASLMENTRTKVTHQRGVLCLPDTAHHRILSSPATTQFIQGCPIHMGHPVRSEFQINNELSAHTQSLSHVWLFCDLIACSPPGTSVHGIF